VRRRKDVRQSREVVAGETRWSRRGARSLHSLLGFGIGVGKGWEVVLKYKIRGEEVEGRTIVRNWGKDVGYQNVTLWVPNIGTITSLREGFGGKSPLFQ